MKNTPKYDTPRNVIVPKLLEYLYELRDMHLDELCHSGNKSSADSRTWSRSEIIVSDILGLLLPQSWVDGESEPLIDEIVSAATPLDIDVNNPLQWQRLIKLTNELEAAEVHAAD